MTLDPIPMNINSEKKYSVRYDAAMPNAAIQSVYIMKTSLPKTIPQTLTVILELPNKE